MWVAVSPLNNKWVLCMLALSALTELQLEKSMHPRTMLTVDYWHDTIMSQCCREYKSSMNNKCVLSMLALSALTEWQLDKS